jgi:hypothetical protein
MYADHSFHRAPPHGIDLTPYKEALKPQNAPDENIFCVSLNGNTDESQKTTQ